MPPHPRLLSLATALPPHRLDQAAVAAAAARCFAGRHPDWERLAGVFDGAGIRQRQAVRPLDWYFGALDWPTRTAAYLDGATDLFEAAATAALARAGLAAAAIDTVVTVSSTGIATPSLEARAAGRLGLRADVARVPLFGLGCAGGVSGLALAGELARARPGSIVLLVVVELCTLAFRADRLDKADIVAAALFGDGAAAAVLCADDAAGGLATLTARGEHRWPDTLDVMGWTVDREGFGVVFDRAIPPFVATHLGAALGGILARAGLDRRDVDRLAFHPGGARVVDALERGCDLPAGALDHERAVLADHGNMSAPTALFVLDRLIAAGLPRRTLLTAMGPGFTASSVALRAA